MALAIVGKRIVITLKKSGFDTDIVSNVDKKGGFTRTDMLLSAFLHLRGQSGISLFVTLPCTVKTKGSRSEIAQTISVRANRGIYKEQ